MTLLKPWIQIRVGNAGEIPVDIEGLTPAVWRRLMPVQREVEDMHMIELLGEAPVVAV